MNLNYIYICVCMCFLYSLTQSLNKNMYKSLYLFFAHNTYLYLVSGILSIIAYKMIALFLCSRTLRNLFGFEAAFKMVKKLTKRLRQIHLEYNRVCLIFYTVKTHTLYRHYVSLKVLFYTLNNYH